MSALSTASPNRFERRVLHRAMRMRGCVIVIVTL